MINRLYILSDGALEERGLISPAEMLDVTWLFFRECRKRSVKAVYLDGGYYAEKNGTMLTLTIGEVSGSIPSRMLEVALEEMMARTFGQ